MRRPLSQEHFIIAFLLLVAVASAADLTADIKEGVNTSHLVQEGAILALALCGVALIAASLRRRVREVRQLKADVEALEHAARNPPEQVVAARRQLATAISTQFDAWSLTPSEREVGLLLLKGFSLKEISELRGTTEKTIRQQASAVYKKAGLAGRHAFSAWFIEDIL